MSKIQRERKHRGRGITIVPVASEQPMADAALDRWIQQYAEAVAENEGITTSTQVAAA